jgi:hypothetical protein
MVTRGQARAHAAPQESRFLTRTGRAAAAISSAVPARYECLAPLCHRPHGGHDRSSVPSCRSVELYDYS